MRFLTRAGCHLCEEARPLVEAELARAGGELEVVDVDHDDDLLAEFGLRIPVVLGPGGVVLAEGSITRRALRRSLRRLG